MTLEFTDAQKHALARLGKPYPADFDVRKWPFKDRNDLFLNHDLITIFLAAHASYGSTYSEVCLLPKYTLAAVSPTFAEHLLENPNLNSFTFDVGRMDEVLQQEHEKAVNTLKTWLINLSTSDITELKARTFHSEVGLRHIARQLDMSFYLTDRTDIFVRDAQTHKLQPWQITELLYASSIETDAPFPIIMEDDPLLLYLAQRMVETTRFLWAEEKKEVSEWLQKEENQTLASTMQKLPEWAGVV